MPSPLRRESRQGRQWIRTWPAICVILDDLQVVPPGNLGDLTAPIEVAGERARQCRQAGGRPLGQQPGRKQPLSVPTTRAGDDQVQATEDLTEVRLGPCQRPQPFQPGAPSRRSPDIQGTPLSRLGRVANRRELGCHPQRLTCAVWRRVRITDGTFSLHSPSGPLRLAWTKDPCKPKLS